jgi:hypothetical protein
MRRAETIWMLTADGAPHGVLTAKIRITRSRPGLEASCLAVHQGPGPVHRPAGKDRAAAR